MRTIFTTYTGNLEKALSKVCTIPSVHCHIASLESNSDPFFIFPYVHSRISSLENHSGYGYTMQQ